MDNRTECQVREDADGQVHFRKDPKVEVVTEELLAAREAVIHEESLLVPLGKILEEINFQAAQGQDVDLEQKEEIQARVRAQAEVLDAARENLAQVLSSGPAGVGGTLVL